MNPKKYSIVLDAKMAKLLEDAAEKFGKTAEEQLTEYFEKLLEQEK